MKNNNLQYEILSNEAFLNTYGGEITTETSFMYDVAFVLGALVNAFEIGYGPAGVGSFFYAQF